jgi:hypothetical protein
MKLRIQNIGKRKSRNVVAATEATDRTAAEEAASPEAQEPTHRRILVTEAAGRKLEIPSLPSKARLVRPDFGRLFRLR